LLRDKAKYITSVCNFTSTNNNLASSQITMQLHISHEQLHNNGRQLYYNIKQIYSNGRQVTKKDKFLE
jgi:hypothetical protein